ncbi:MAG: thiamine phosphate synthase [Candidatus Polarisedimenticolia bacterium]
MKRGGGGGAGPRGVCFVTDRGATGGRPLLEVIRAALAGGAVMVQVREKDLEARALLELALRTVEAADAAGKGRLVVVNDRFDVALAAKAGGVHLPGEGLPIAGVRHHAPRRFLVGRSVHSVAEARQAEKEGADYVFFGPVFATPGKAAFGPPQGTAALRKTVEAVRIPVWAIGGIRVETAAELAGIPVAGIAVISAIAGAADPEAAARNLDGAAVAQGIGGAGATASGPRAS